uniref:Junctional cadherin 5 associated a n=1 Tax=Takifugu rubripes TaxID=31033 RepID=A0A674P080_TAKRU
MAPKVCSHRQRMSLTGEGKDSGPPGYIPPPSYKRAPVMGGGHRGFGEIPVDYRYKGGVYQQIHMAPDGSHWITRHPVGFWPDLQRERNMSGQKQLYPVYTSQEHHGGGIQYIPFDDPRIRHISSALGGNSLTDADKIRHICNELPSVTVSEPSTINSAFLPPPLAPSITAKLAADANQTCSTNLDNDSNRWHSDLHNETVDNFQAIDQNCNNRYPKKCRPPSSPSSAFQVPLTRICSQQGTSLDHVFAETITQVKKIVPDSGTENNSNTKRRVSETIFCLVSVPVHTSTNVNKDLAADQNNNETIQGLTVTTDTFAVGLKESLNIRSKSVNEMPMKSHYARFHTSSTSSLKNYKRAPLRKEIIDAWILQANDEKEICYTASWPGNQYRNQETQTGSPLTVLKSPESQSPPPHGQEPVQSVSGKTTESDLSTEYCHSYGYPMAGQKNLQLSSNSAFSRLSLSPTQLSLTQFPSSPSKTQTQESVEQVAFGQFLLKPVNRRPFDAIGELESINKEMEDTISKRPNVAKHHDGLNGLNDRFQQFKLANFTVGLDLDREAISLPPMHTDKSSEEKVRSKSFASTTDLAFMDREIVFSKIQTTSLPPANELSLPTNQCVSDSCLLPLHSPQNGSNQLYRQDIPVLQESLLRDVGLTVYTETPGGPGEPIKRSLSVPSPLDLNKLSESVQELWENRTAQVQSSGGLKDNSDKDLPDRLQTKRNAKSDSDVPSSGHVNLRICRSDSDNTCKKHISSIITQRRREVSFVFKTNDNDVRSTISEPPIYKIESTIADKHLQNLLILEKANSLSAQDLSNLYEVKCAKGIPENESIEQRAARILGISVPVEALGVGGKQSERKHDDDEEDATVSDKLRNPPEETEKLIEEGKKVKEDVLNVEATIKEVNGTEGNCEEVIQKHSDDNEGKKNLDIEFQSMLVLDLPEFPPSKLPLSLPVTPNEKQVLGMCTGEKRGQNGACKATKSLQYKINCLAASLGRSATDRTARLKELGSVSRIRQLSLKGSQSEKKESEKNPSDIPKQKLEAADDGKAELEREKKGEMNEKERPVGYPDVACTSKETTKETDGKWQRKEEKTNEIKDMMAIKSENESAKGDVNFKSKGAVLELSLAEDDKVKPLKKEEKKTSKVHGVKGVDREITPKPRQRTKLQKPPLLPKPLSVPKREITLPLRTSMSTCSPSSMDDEEVHSVSDSYDPTRVEQV